MAGGLTKFFDTVLGPLYDQKKKKPRPTMVKRKPPKEIVTGRPVPGTPKAAVYRQGKAKESFEDSLYRTEGLNK